MHVHGYGIDDHPLQFRRVRNQLADLAKSVINGLANWFVSVLVTLLNDLAKPYVNQLTL